MDQLVKLPNRISERQRLYQNSSKPIYFRPPRSRLYLGLWFTGFTVGMVGVTYGIVELIKGKPSEA